MKFSKKMREIILKDVKGRKKICLEYIMELIETESKKNGEYASIQDFIVRMLNANLDIHAFTILEKYVPMRFPNNGDNSMFRPVLALMGYDPDYSAAPDIEVYPLSHFMEPWDDDDLPFN